jgi:putative peptidoglycan lipid II flippase
MDAYNVAFRIPNLVRDLFAEGAMSAAFVPTFTRRLADSGKIHAWRLGNHVVNALLVVTGLLTLLGIVFAEPLVRLLTADDFTADPDTLALTVLLARIMLPALVFIALAAALMGMLNALRHYFIPALSPAMFNVVTIAAVLTLTSLMPVFGLQPITAVAIGTLLGAVAQLGLQVPALRGEGFRYRPVLDWRDEGLGRVLTLMGPGTIGLAATQVNLFVNTLLATTAGTGAVSWLNYAFRLMYVPIGLFGVSVATAVLPTVSRFAAEDSRDGMRTTVANGMSLMFVMNIPATVGLIVLAEPIVQLLFERGRFTPEDTVATAAALQLYALGLVAYSVVRIASPTFYAIGRSRIPVAASIATVVVNAALNVALVRLMGYRGLALGTSIAAAFNASLLLLLLRRNLEGLQEGRLLASLARIVVASGVMGVAAWSTDVWLTGQLPGDALAVQTARLLATIGVSLSVLVLAAWLLRIREFGEGVAIVTRRIGRTK